ncbi:FAD-dependent oxidoreductase [Novipirellula caenicola]|uniref:Golvesin/Xly CBD-like domain-containing protein n=1 Tax=Novipirellula caenicola TaxID=1536901 RepID=A0ABP9VVA5_9BACT
MPLIPKPGRILKKRSIFSVGITLTLLALMMLASPAYANENRSDTEVYDVVIYGGTAAGVVAAVQVERMGGSAIVIEPSSRIGGLTTGGLGQTDIGNKAAIGGISREFYERISQYYQKPENWKWQTAEQYKSGGQSRTAEGEATMWTFEPSAALHVLQGFVDEHNVKVVYNERLDRTGSRRSGQVGAGVEIVDGKIKSIRCVSGNVYRGRMFIDATYEGDLFATAGISYTVGREANATYGETLSGVQTANARHHQLMPGVDPYVRKGDPESGLLPGIDPTGPGEEGSADHRVQAYCFRVCLTDHPENRIPFFKPEDYDPSLYELMLRNFEAGQSGFPVINSAMPNRKTDTNNRTGFSTDFIGQNYDYPEATDEEREQIIQRHRVYQQGLFWTMANHPRVPEATRKIVSRWGTCKDEFEREDGWQQQLYIREARRLIGAEVMTQHHCQGRKVAEDAVGMAAYTMDSHNVQRYVDENGHARNEGDVQVGGFPPYPISYRSLLPKSDECTNLLVPVSLSASHMAFGSIRMEPVFMVLGQSSATAAIQAIRDKQSLHEINYEKLREQLILDKQVLDWTPALRPGYSIDPEKLSGVVLDDVSAERTGFNGAGYTVPKFVGHNYRHDGDADKGQQHATFALAVKEPGRYAVRMSYTANPNRASNVPVTIHCGEKTQTVQVNQRKRPGDDGFVTLAEDEFPSGNVTVTIRNEGTDGYVIIDAVQLQPIQ